MEQMTLNDAIKHLDDILQSGRKWDCEECKNEHIQLRDWLKELKDYKDLEEQGKLLNLHCTVGDTAYVLWGVPTPDKYVIFPAEVKEICFGRYANRKTIKYRLELISYRGRILKFYSDDFGKNFFLTKEEAEATLKGVGK